MKTICISLLFSIILFSSCKPEDNEPMDLEDPNIKTVTINNDLVTENVEGTLFTDSTNQLQIIFGDNTELSQCSVNIHYIDGSHNHDEGISTRLSAETLPFSYGPVLRDLKGKKDTVNLEIPISNDVLLGEYHLEILYTDEAANSAESIYTLDLITK